MTLQTTLRFLLGDQLYRIVTQSPRIFNFIIRPEYETEVSALKFILQPDFVCFDIGAHYGHYSRVLSSKTKFVYAFEPSLITYRGLKFVKTLLRWKNVHVEHCALADVDSEMELHIPIKEHGGLGVSLAHISPSIDRKTLSEKVKVQTLDDFVESHNIQACDFIKCDVEGAELLVLKGGMKTIKKYLPQMMLEIDSRHLKRNGHAVADIQAILLSLGYKFYTLEDESLVPHDDLIDLRNNFALRDLHIS